MKPVRDLVDVVSIPCELAKAGRHSASAVFIPQQLVKDVSSIPQMVVNHGTGLVDAVSITQRLVNTGRNSASSPASNKSL